MFASERLMEEPCDLTVDWTKHTQANFGMS